MLASAVGPSSQGVWKTKWSLAETAGEPAVPARRRRSACSRCERERLLTELHQRQMDAELHRANASQDAFRHALLASARCRRPWRSTVSGSTTASSRWTAASTGAASRRALRGPQDERRCACGGHRNGRGRSPHPPLPLAELAPAGPGAEDWILQAAVAGATLSLTPGPTYEHVPDAGRAFAFPAGKVEAGGTPRRFRPSYDGLGALSIHSMPPARRAPASTKAAGRARRRRVRAALRAARAPARMLAHRLAHAP